jgi:hypothetical protein
LVIAGLAPAIAFFDYPTSGTAAFSGSPENAPIAGISPATSADAPFSAAPI